MWSSVDEAIKHIEYSFQQTEKLKSKLTNET